MIALWVVVAVAVEIAAGRAVGGLFRRRRSFDTHVREALAVVEPSDDFELWRLEIIQGRGAA